LRPSLSVCWPHKIATASLDGALLCMSCRCSVCCLDVFALCLFCFIDVCFVFNALCALCESIMIICAISTAKGVVTRHLKARMD